MGRLSKPFERRCRQDWDSPRPVDQFLPRRPIHHDAIVLKRGREVIPVTFGKWPNEHWRVKKDLPEVRGTRFFALAEFTQRTPTPGYQTKTRLSCQGDKLV